MWQVTCRIASCSKTPMRTVLAVAKFASGCPPAGPGKDCTAANRPGAASIQPLQWPIGGGLDGRIFVALAHPCGHPLHHPPAFYNDHGEPDYLPRVPASFPGAFNITPFPAGRSNTGCPCASHFTGCMRGERLAVHLMSGPGLAW